MNFLRPATLDEALEMMAQPPAPCHGKPTPIAGGTDLLVSWPSRDKDGITFLDLSPLAGELKFMRLTPDALELGALTTYWDVTMNHAICGAFPLLRVAGLQVGALQIQTRGTWVGNIGNGSPAADGVPSLIAYDAEVLLASKRGRRSLPLCQYWTGYKRTQREPDELIIGLRLPRRERNIEFWHKVGARSALTITKVGAAVVQTATPGGDPARGPDEPNASRWRVVANSAAPYVKRCHALEQALERGEMPDSPEATLEILKADISPIDDIRSTAEYRAHVLSRIIFFGLREHMAPAAA